MQTVYPHLAQGGIGALKSHTASDGRGTAACTVEARHHARRTRMTGGLAGCKLRGGGKERNGGAWGAVICRPPATRPHLGLFETRVVCLSTLWFFCFAAINFFLERECLLGQHWFLVLVAQHSTAKYGTRRVWLRFSPTAYTHTSLFPSPSDFAAGTTFKLVASDCQQ